MACVLFCADPIQPREADSDYAMEFEAAVQAGLSPILFDHDEMERRSDPAAALRRTRIGEPGPAIYRGWMLKSENYAALYAGLIERGVELANTPEQYGRCHHAPGSYAALAAWMPTMRWVETAHIDNDQVVNDALAHFGSSPVVLKDWVKSQASGYWNEACFISDASDSLAAKRTIQRFRELQGDDLVGGLVFKAYLPLAPVGSPAHEYRAFVLDGQVVGCWPRDAGAASMPAPPKDLVAAVAKAIPSRFATADFGVDEHGQWWLLEVGDGQVSGLPAAANAQDLFRALAKALS